MTQKARVQSILPPPRWNSIKDPIWLASTLKLYRNLDKYKFPGKLPVDPRKLILDLEQEAILKAPSLNAPQYFPAEKVEPLEKEYLYEYFLASQSFSRAHTGEGFIIDKSGSFLAVLNLREHLQLHYTDTNGELEQAWNKLVSIETELAKNLSFSYSSKFGFLTADSSRCGTGLITHLFLHIPALCNKYSLQELREKFGSDDIVLEGIQDNNDDLVGHIITVQNRYTLGLNEESILSTLRTAATRIAVAEKGLRSQDKQEGDVHVKDLISRSFGLVKHSFQLQTVEAMNALSWLLLGVHIEAISDIDAGMLTDLLFACRRAHLMERLEGKRKQELLPDQRATFIKEKLEKAKFIAN